MNRARRATALIVLMVGLAAAAGCGRHSEPSPASRAQGCKGIEVVDPSVHLVCDQHTP